MKKQNINLSEVMKRLSSIILILIAITIFIGCNGKKPSENAKAADSGKEVLPDTGFTGIKKMMSGRYVVSEIEFKNGIKDGLMRTFYLSGKLRQTFMYINGVKEDSAKWYYEEGQLFRTTPFKNDTIDGIQKQFYRTGRIRAKIGWSKGMRTPFIQEFDNNGKLMGNYPEIVVTETDEYNSKGLYKIGLRLSNDQKKVKFFRGEFTDGRFDTTKCRPVNTLEGKALLELKKSSSPTDASVNVIAEIVTPLGNKYLAQKKITLPYSDLK
jgi:antitoxin component YwqK of YwqJK toxin-antitoxin module